MCSAGRDGRHTQRDSLEPSAFPSKVLGIGDERLGVQMRYSHSPVPNRQAPSALANHRARTSTRSFQLQRILDPRKLGLSALHPLSEVGRRAGAGNLLDFVA